MKSYNLSFVSVRLFCLTVFVFLFSFSSRTQTTVVIGNNTAANGTSVYPCALGDYFGGQHAQYLYNNAAMSGAGIPAGALITQIGWVANATNISGHLIEGFSIKLKNTTITGVSSTAWESGATAVYGPQDYSYISGSAGNILFTLTASFTYDGTGLLVDVCHGAATTGLTSNPALQYQTAVGYNASHSYRSNNVNGCSSAITTNTGTLTTRPRLVITYVIPPACSGTPNAPVATLTETSSFCYGGFRSMGASGFSVATGLTTQWQVSSTPGGPYTNVSDGTGAAANAYTTSILPAGNYYYVCTSTCIATGDTATSNEIALTVNALPSVVINAPNNGAFCGTQQMNAAGASTYSWTPAASLSSVTGSSVYYTGISDTQVTVIGTDENGCVGSPVSQQVYYTPPVPIAMTTGVPHFCGDGGTTIVTASSSENYVYSFDGFNGATLSGFSSNSVEATVTQTSIIRVTGFDLESGCAAQGFASLSVYPLPTAALTAFTNDGGFGVCPGTTGFIQAGLNSTNFSVTSIPYVPFSIPATATIVVSNGVTSIGLSGGNLDDGGWSGLPLGFNFNFFNNTYSSVSASTNGFLMFGSALGYSTSPGDLGQYSFSANPVFPNGNNGGNLIALMAGDQYFGNGNPNVTPSDLIYWTEGFAPNRKFIILYREVRQAIGGSTSGTFTAYAALHETTGIIEIHILNNSQSIANTIGLQNANKSIGITAPGRQNFTTPISSPEAWRLSPPVNYLTDWSAADINGTYPITTNYYGTPLNSQNEFAISVSQQVTTTYFLTLRNVLTGCSNSANPNSATITVLSTNAPSGFNVTSLLDSVCPEENFLLTANFLNGTLALSFQWQVSIDGGLNYNDIYGANSTTYMASQSVSSLYRIGVASCGGIMGYSEPIAVTIKSFLSCYCTVPFVNGSDEDILNVSIGQLNNSSTCGSLAPGIGSVPSRYSNYADGPNSPDILTLYTGEVVTGSLTIGSCSSSNFFSGATIFIDYNRNGLFTDPEERVWSNGNDANISCVPASVVPVSFIVSQTASFGLTRLRVINSEGHGGASIQPCSSYFYGETEDYLVEISYLCENDYSFLADSAKSCGAPVILEAPEGMDSYLWNTGETTRVISTNLSGAFICTITYGECTRVDTTNVFILDPTVVSNDYEICEGDAVTLSVPNAIGSSLSYSWSNLSVNPSVEVIADAVATYSCEVSTAEQTCEGSFTIYPNPIVSFFPDADGDSYGANANSILGCVQPEGYVTDSTDCNDNEALTFPGTLAVSADSATTNTFCAGTTLELQAATASAGITYQWYLNGTLIPNETNQNISVSSGGNYQVSINQNGCTAVSNIVSITELPSAIIPSILVEQANAGCVGGDATLTVSGGNYTNLVWNNGLTANSIIVNTSGDYSITAIDENGCAVSAGPVAVNFSILDSVPVCIVTVDQITGKNNVVWEPITSDLINSYVILKETNVANEYAQVGTVAYGSNGIFEDVNSNPQVQANRYKLALIDTCGIQSSASSFHKTIHLTTNLGVGNNVNLIWSNYEGFDFGSYTIYRGTSPNSLNLLSTIASNLNSYTDVNPPASETYYMIEVAGVSCDPQRTLVYSNSNILDTTVGIEDHTSNTISLYPNPANAVIMLQVNNTLIGQEYVVFDAIGKVIFKNKIQSTNEIIQLENFNIGNYFIKVNEVVKRFVVQH